MIDCGVLGDPPIAPDIAAAEIARAGGSDLSLLRRQRDRAAAIPAMMAGLQAVLADLLRQGTIAAFMGIGGGTNAALAAAAFRTLPFGMPKLLVSTRRLRQHAVRFRASRTCCCFILWLMCSA